MVLNPNDPLIVGFTRFSLVTARTLSSFVSTRGKTLEAAQDFIWAEPLMRHRFTMLEAICVKNYAMLEAQTTGSRAVFMISASMPERLKQRFQSIIAPLKNAVVCELSDTDAPGTMAALVLEEIADGRRVYSHRIDDDDALSADFTATVFDYAKIIKDEEVLSFDHGYTFCRLGDDIFRLEERRRPLIAIGLGVFSSPASYISILQLGSHRKIAEKWPIVHHKAVGSWLRGSHGMNDSSPRVPGGKNRTMAETIAAIRPSFPHIDAATLRAMPVRTGEQKGPAS